MQVIRRVAAHCGLKAGSWPPLAIGMAVLGAVVARLTHLEVPLTPDEGGFLFVADQWHAGQSLYGNYWVDRPPVLITLFAWIGALGGDAALRAAGLAAVLASIGIAAWIGNRLARRRGMAVAAVVTAAFASTPLFGAAEVGGETLALPFVLAGVGLVLTSSRWTAWAVAGLVGVLAVGIKQNLADVFVVAGTVVGAQLLGGARARALICAAALAASTVLTGAVILVWAHAHGTSPAAVWDAVVTFRAQAGEVIRTEASPATGHRAFHLLVAALASGAVVVFGALLAPSIGGRRTNSPLKREVVTGLVPGVLALIAWEVLGVALGGSYWLHYLMGLVPGLAVGAVVAVRRRPWRLRWIAVAVLIATIGAAVSWPDVDHRAVDRDRSAVEWLRHHRHRGDSAIVAWGDPALLYEAGLRSPYPELWSLPVRTRDPHLTEFISVISGPRRPRWIVVKGGELASWGIDAGSATVVLEQRYAKVTVQGEWTIYRRRTAATAPTATHTTAPSSASASTKSAPTRTGVPSTRVPSTRWIRHG